MCWFDLMADKCRMRDGHSLRCANRTAAGRAPQKTCSRCRFRHEPTVNLHTQILDFRGFDSSCISTPRGGIVMSKGNFPEMLSQQILVGMILVGRLGVGFAIAHSAEAGRTWSAARGSAPQNISRGLTVRQMDTS